jgi:hypothetical protein
MNPYPTRGTWVAVTDLTPLTPLPEPRCAGTVAPKRDFVSAEMFTTAFPAITFPNDEGDPE